MSDLSDAEAATARLGVCKPYAAYCALIVHSPPNMLSLSLAVKGLG